MAWFVDTNIFLRLATEDASPRADACAQLFERCRTGEVKLMTTEVVVAEIFYVLTSPRQYGFTRDDAAAFVADVLELPELNVRDRRLVTEALEAYRSSNLDFEDCLAAARIARESLEGIYSYDRGFDAVDGLVRREPEQTATNGAP